MRDECIRDVFFEYRLRHLIYEGRLEIKGVPRAMRYYGLRLKKRTDQDRMSPGSSTNVPCHGSPISPLIIILTRHTKSCPKGSLSDDYLYFFQSILLFSSKYSMSLSRRFCSTLRASSASFYFCCSAFNSSDCCFSLLSTSLLKRSFRVTGLSAACGFTAASCFRFFGHRSTPHYNVA